MKPVIRPLGRIRPLRPFGMIVVEMIRKNCAWVDIADAPQRIPAGMAQICALARSRSNRGIPVSGEVRICLARAAIIFFLAAAFLAFAISGFTGGKKFFLLKLDVLPRGVADDDMQTHPSQGRREILLANGRSGVCERNDQLPQSTARRELPLEDIPTPDRWSGLVHGPASEHPFFRATKCSDRKPFSVSKLGHRARSIRQIADAWLQFLPGCPLAAPAIQKRLLRAQFAQSPVRVRVQHSRAL